MALKSDWKKHTDILLHIMVDGISDAKIPFCSINPQSLIMKIATATTTSVHVIHFHYEIAVLFPFVRIATATGFEFSHLYFTGFCEGQVRNTCDKNYCR